MENEALMAIPQEIAFSLVKVKMGKTGGLDIHFTLEEVVGDEMYTNKYHYESAKEIHPDLRAMFKRLRPFVIQVFGMNDAADMVLGEGFGANTEQRYWAEDYKSGMVDYVDVMGFSISGQEENKGVILNAMYVLPCGQKTPINTPRIKYQGGLMGFEAELELFIKDIQHEVYQYMFQGKRAEMTLFGDNGECQPGRMQ